ncbi:MAG TPA: acyl carrier protein [Longimicrobium sp.]|nr:acyl carrier protein [Longimicrobium sp.]
MTDGTQRRDAIKAAIAAQLQLPVEMLRDDATLASLGLDSLGMAQAVVAVEESLGYEVDTALLSERLTEEMTVGALVEGVEASLVGRAAARSAG